MMRQFTLTAEDRWYAQATKGQQKRVQSVQWDLLQTDFGKDQPFRARACWQEAVRRVRGESQIDPEEDVFNLEEP